MYFAMYCLWINCSLELVCVFYGLLGCKQMTNTSFQHSNSNKTLNATCKYLLHHVHTYSSLAYDSVERP